VTEVTSKFGGILAFNDPYHDSSFCLYGPDEIRHVEIERLSRVKYDSQNPIAAFCDMYFDRLDNFPVVAIEEGEYLAPAIRQILADKAVPAADDALARLVPSAPRVRRQAAQPLAPETAARIRALFRHLIESRAAIHFCGHHEAHAANAFHSSGYDEALVVTLDGGGYDWCDDATGGPERREIYGSVYRYRGREATLVEQLQGESFGLAWFRANDILGLAWGEEGTVMAMAALGDAARFADVFAEPFFWQPNAVRLDDDAGQALAQFLAQTRQRLRVEQDRYDLAAALQLATERRVERYLHRFVGPEVANLCVAGGLFLNCQLLGKLPQWFPALRNVYIPPAPYDGGISIGVAQKVAHERVGLERQAPPGLLAPFAMGRQYSAGAVRAACDAAGATPQAIRLEEVIARLAAGQVVAVFAGAAESGRRALGNRSILGDPRRADIKSRINDEIKHRQWFRPLAPMVLADHVAEWFQCPPGFSSPYMSFAIPVRPERRSAIPAVTHLDGSARIQTVHRDLSPITHALLEAWHARTGVPILINTSFNDREPIVETPDDALRTFRQVPIDLLYFADFGLAVTPPREREPGPDRSRPTASRLDEMVGQTLALRRELLAAVASPAPVAQRLQRLFTAADVRRTGAVEPYRDIAGGVWIGFQPTATVELRIAPKEDDVASPDGFLNTVRIAFTGRSTFLSLEAPVAWSELCDCDHFQLALCAEPSRPVSCEAALRVFRRDGSFLDLSFARFSLQPGRRNANKFGNLSLRDLLGIAATRPPLLLIFFDTAGSLDLRLDYINLYFG
jgi:carbamoyltransferase